MGHDEFQYERVFCSLKSKIESGLMPYGCVLPSTAKLCKEYKVSDKTMRRVFTMLADAGLIETRRRQRAIVIFDKSVPDLPVQPLKEANSVAMTDILKTAELLCYPLICKGILLCGEADWTIPEQLASQMDPALPSQFWRNSKLFWRFFIARCENELALRVVDSVGFLDLEYQTYPIRMRMDYQCALLQFVEKSKKALYSEEDIQRILSAFFYLTPWAIEHFECFVPEESPLRTGVLNSEQWMKTAEERYLSVYLDILGLISVGAYKPGDQLPSHAAMQKQYGVSVTTTLQAIKKLKQYGAVETTRGKGIFVSANPGTLDNIPIPPQLVAKYVKRCLDAMELLSCTASGVALHVSSGVSQEQAQTLFQKVKDMADISKLYQPAPLVILEFLTEGLRYDTMRAVYKTILEHYHIGRKIPKLVNNQNASEKRELHHRCVNAACALVDGNTQEFAWRTAEMFQYMQQQTILECKRLQYLNMLAEYYDGSQLWK